MSSPVDIKENSEEKKETVSRNFIENIIDKDIEEGRCKKVVTRFPPEPNGYLHIGHAKSIILNSGLAKEYGGQFNLRFDDTNPTKEKSEFVDSILEDVKWICGDLDMEHVFYASDYFDMMYECAVKLIKKGKAKIYDHNFKDIFNDLYEAEYKDKFEAAGIEYFYTLIDDAVARVMKAKGGFIWACKNYDGDVMSDMVSSACGSLAMMTSVLVSPSGVYEYEAAHGTVQRHYYKHLKGEETSTNSVATIFAWTGALRKRGELDNIPELMTFAEKLEKATLGTIESGKMTKDLALITSLENVTVLNSQDFIKAIKENLDKELA